jgi:hypothetical protein
MVTNLRWFIHGTNYESVDHCLAGGVRVAGRQMNRRVELVISGGIIGTPLGTSATAEPDALPPRK